MMMKTLMEKKIEIKNSIIIDFNKRLKNYEKSVMKYLDLSPDGDPLEAANNLFEFMRISEKVKDCEIILLPNLTKSNTEHSDAVFDRIFRAASGNFANNTKNYIYFE